MAYARLAVFYGNSVQLEQAKDYAIKAFDLRERVSEREKLYISEKYHNYVTGEVDRAIEVLKQWSQTQEWIVRPAGPWANISSRDSPMGKRKSCARGTAAAGRTTYKTGHRNSNNYVRRLAYLKQQAAAEAAKEFQAILDHRQIDIISPLHSLAHLGLARAAAAKGDTALSRKKYRDFFAAWKNADSTLPILIEAKKEYEAIK